MPAYEMQFASSSIGADQILLRAFDSLGLDLLALDSRGLVGQRSYLQQVSARQQGSPLKQGARP
jgi:hypothetical protein